MTRWVIVGGGTAGCVAAAELAAGRPADEIVIAEAGSELGGASLINGGVVVGDPGRYHHRLPLEPPAAIGTVGAALIAADPGAAPVLLARRGGRRVSAAAAYLDPLPANVAVLPGAAATRVLLEGRTVVGVATAAGELPADRVVVCAGAIGTPALLLRSGVDTPGIGLGLQDHVGVALAASPAVAPVGERPDVTVTAEHGEHQIIAIEPNATMGGYGALVGGWLAVRSTGSVTLPELDGEPVVDTGRLQHPLDQAGLAATAAALLRLVGHDAVRAVADEWYADAHGTTLAALLASGDDGVAAWVAAATSPYHHAAGSCRVGIVTDTRGWVRGYTGLAVADASALPGVPRRNPYLAVIDQAGRLARGWGLDNGPRRE